MIFSDYSKDFSLMPQHTWLNVASEGPLPKIANQALQKAIEWKSAPHLLTIPKFQQVPLELKSTIARLIHVEKEDVILGNSATYGLHLLSNGLDFKSGDELILLQNDFPTDILPWLSLEQKGVIVHQLKAVNHVLTTEEIKKVINHRTKLICLPLIHSFTGFKHDIKSIGQLCRSHGILCVVNLSQAAGAFDIDLGEWDIDAVTCAGYKWLLGPYGTGFCWIKKEVREQLNYHQNYWISLMDEAGLASEGPISLNDDHSVRRYDVFGTANFFNYVPWVASIEYLLNIGLKKIERHNQILVDKIVDGLAQDYFELISPHPKTERTNIVVFSHKDASKNEQMIQFLKNKGFYLAFWRNKLRVSPHIYNTKQDIEGLLTGLEEYAST
jgi:cysteine desulfurase/selenocysteine lyase